jgi:hypothetical protein
MNRSLIICVATVVFAGLLGCSKTSPDGVDVWGNVEWKGNPVPSGIVTFTPDAAKGNRGHQGWAIIENGRFDTRNSGSKSSPKGACIVTISDKQPSTDPAHPAGTSIIVKYDQAMEMPSASGELNLIVPDGYVPLISFPNGDE